MSFSTGSPFACPQSTGNPHCQNPPGTASNPRGSGIYDARTGMPSGIPEGAMCVQRFDDSLNSAIHITYRISLRSSSMWEPRDPLLKVLTFFCFVFCVQTSVLRKGFLLGFSPRLAGASFPGEATGKGTQRVLVGTVARGCQNDGVNAVGGEWLGAFTTPSPRGLSIMVGFRRSEPACAVHLCRGIPLQQK